jgi:hypothetical protein
MITGSFARSDAKYCPAQVMYEKICGQACGEEIASLTRELWLNRSYFLEGEDMKRKNDSPSTLKMLAGVVVPFALLLISGLAYIFLTDDNQDSVRNLTNTADDLAVDTEVIIGANTSEGAVEAERALANPAQIVGQTVKVRGEVTRQVSPEAFYLDRDGMTGQEEILVIVSSQDSDKLPVRAGNEVIVAGRVDLLKSADLVPREVRNAVGKPVLIVDQVSH